MALRSSGETLRALGLVFTLVACTSMAVAGDRRDIVFDCPCSAEWVAGKPGEPGGLALSAGIVSHRATESGEIRLSARWWDGADGAFAQPLPARHRELGEWTLAFEEPEADAVIEVHLLEQTGRLAQGSAQWHRHETLVLWPVPGNDTVGPTRFVDILTDSDGDGVGDVNEWLSSSSWEDSESTPGDSVIDVLMLYTVGFREAEAGYPYTRLLHAITVSGALFEDSGTNLRLRAVGMSEVELGDNGWARSEDRQELMDAHGADLTVQFSPTGPCSSGGCAQVGARRTSRWSDASVWDRGASAWVTVHELGHALGLAHSARQGETYGAWRWSRGHYVTPRGEKLRFGTIMAYGFRLFGGVFSDPTSDCGSGPCGVDGDELDGADSVTTLDLLRFQISAHREPATDTDEDGFVDAADIFPDDPGDWFDVDGDGTGDNADLDDDNDGTPDVDDPFPLDPDEWADADLDGVGDNADDDVQDLNPFRDPALRSAAETALGKGAGAPITAEDMAGLTELPAANLRIRNLTGLELATGLERLWLYGNLIRDLSPLSGLTALQVLDLRSNEVADLSPLSELPALNWLFLSDNPVADIGPLSGLSVCTDLFLDRTHVEFADVRALPYFSQLRGLGLSGLGVQDVSPLAELPLRYLSLAGNPIADLLPLAGLAELWFLDLSDTGLTEVDFLAGLNGLVHLYLAKNHISDVSPLSEMTGLQNLNLFDNAISDVGPLERLVNLETLNLSANRITDASPLSAMTALTWLDLRDNAVTDIDPLEPLVNLESLNLSGNRIADAAPLSAMTALTWLDLHDNAVTDIGSLEPLINLETLNLSGNRIADVSPLSAMTALTWLDSHDNAVTDIGPLEPLVNLETLNLSGNRTADVSPLSAMTALTRLDLTGNAVSDIGPLVDRSVFGGVASAGAFVNLDGNPLDDQSVKKHIPLLRSWGINVRFTRRGSKATPAPIADPTLRALIVEALAFATLHVDDELSEWPIDQLRTLRLYRRGITTLAGLDAAKGLESLLADSNRIADLSPLAELSSLSVLDLRHNRISDLSPLVANAELADGDRVALEGNPLSEDSLNIHIPALVERGVVVSVGSIVLTLVAGSEPVHFDTSGYFEALLGAGIGMTASSDDVSLAAVEASNGALVVEPGERGGTAVVTVEARDDQGAVEKLTFFVRVRGPWLVPLFPTASGAREGFVRVVNHGIESGVVRIAATDDAGARSGPLTLTIGGDEAVHFNSSDLETGNLDKGLTGSSGRGMGDWGLELESALELEVLSYIRTPDGFLTAMHDLVPTTETGHRVPIFNPASNVDQVSLLRLTNLGSEGTESTISGIDDHGEAPGGDVSAYVAAGATLLLTAQDLETGGSGLRGRLGDGAGKWRLLVGSDGDLSVMNLLLSPGGHLTNLSTSAPAALDANGVHTVPLFLSAADPLMRQGFVRVVNRAGAEGKVRIQPFDDSGRRYDVLSLALGAGRTAHFNSHDLELGNVAKGLSGSTGSGTGDWRLELSSELDIEVLAYIRTAEGFLTSVHDTVHQSGRRYDLATFNPGSNTGQASRLRIVNPGARPAHVSVGGIDDGGMSAGGVVRMTVPPGAGLLVTAAQLEGADYYPFQARGTLVDGTGKWRLQIDSEQDILVMNLLASPTGHLTNLSTSPNR